VKLTPQLSLSFNGNCEAAFRHYERCLDGSLYILHWKDSPAAAEVPPEWGDKVYHATLKIGDGAISGNDLPDDRYQRPQGFEVILQTDNPVFAERAFDGLSEGGVVGMPLQETFWAARFGVVRDRFGMRWSVNCEAPVAATR
jgi:PhnB protein